MWANSKGSRVCMYKGGRRIAENRDVVHKMFLLLQKANWSSNEAKSTSKNYTGKYVFSYASSSTLHPRQRVSQS